MFSNLAKLDSCHPPSPPLRSRVNECTKSLSANLLGSRRRWDDYDGNCRIKISFGFAFDVTEKQSLQHEGNSLNSYFRSLLAQKIQFHTKPNRYDDGDRGAKSGRLLTSSSTHRRYVHDGQLSLYVDHGHGVPSSDAYRDGRGSS
jgi:hypothetical protein